MIDQVICIRDDWSHGGLSQWPRVGMIYTIREIIWRDAVSDRPPMMFYRLEEVRNPQRRVSMNDRTMSEPMFCAEWFRSVRRTSIDDIKKVALPTGLEPVLTE